MVNVGDAVKVKVLGFDERGKVKLSMRVVDQATGADITEQVGAEAGRQRPRATASARDRAGATAAGLMPRNRGDRPRGALSKRAAARIRCGYKPCGPRCARMPCIAAARVWRRHRAPGAMPDEGGQAMRAINAIRMGGIDVLPLVEGGKGVAISNGISSGNWAAAGGVGTFSAVNADSFDDDGEPIPQVYHGRTRRERHEELVAYAIKGGSTQARRAYELAGGKGRIHANILWEMGAAERIITEVLERAKGIINGITCGAGMPYRLSEIAARFNVHYYPIVSSARAFNALWKRAYSKAADLLGGVVYEDPWLAGGHNGLSNSEDPDRPEDPLSARRWRCAR